MDIPADVRRTLLAFQANEITEHIIYSRLAGIVASPENREILRKVAGDELAHYEAWKAMSGQDVAPNRWKIFIYYWVSRIAGITFGLKIMEQGEERAQAGYDRLSQAIPQAKKILHEENEHETALLNMLDEEHLRYAGSIVLGLNDALVELTGALAGLTLALQNTRLIALTGLVTGIAAALSMAASEYLSTRSEATSSSGRNPLRASIYTGVAYVLVVAILIAPYLLLSDYYLALAVTLSAAVGIIAFFNYYIAVAKGEPFRSRFVEMLGLSLGVAVFSFILGYVLKAVLGVEV
ncbi:MAG TPA: VIT1/CCC1 transporter family protein [Anaerolineales bacterium]|nr:VIT1/CCC1 transporter family protein [Anaerolineales bacterium]